MLSGTATGLGAVQRAKGHAVDLRHQRVARVADAAEPSLEILAGPGVQEDLARVRGQRAARAGLLVDLAAVDEPADGVRAPFEGVGMEVGRGVEAEVDHGLVSALAGSVVVDLHLSRRLADELAVDLVVRRAAESGPGIGEEACDDAGRRERLEAG